MIRISFKMSETNYSISDNFTYQNGNLYCENVDINTIRNSMDTEFPQSPFFVYSKAAILNNIRQYKSAMSDINYILNYSMKANNNITILKLMKEQGCSLTLVSGMELRLALDLGFDPSKLMFNGNGKMKWELEMAINAGALLNVDSVFNLKQTMDVCEKLGESAHVLLRINPSIDVNVHKYFATGKGGSKFGLDKDELEDCLQILCTTEHKVNVVGLHCHLGSTIDEVKMIRSCVEMLLSLWKDLKVRGFTSLKYLNIGGGLGIPYEKHADRTCPFESKDRPLLEQLEQNLAATEHTANLVTKKDNSSSKTDHKHLKLHIDGLEEILQTITDYKQYKISRFTFQNVLKKHPHVEECIPIGLKQGVKQYPTIQDLIDSIQDLITDSDVTLVLEPGRSLVGNAAVFITTVLGCKKSNDKRYIVIDGAMNDVIRPSFYRAYHHIDFTEPCYKLNEMNENTKQVYDIVGPVCECADFLGQDRLLGTPFEGCGLAVFDVGAYCSTLASNYNMRLKPGEVMVDGDKWRFIRHPDRYEDLIRNYTDKPNTEND